MIKDVLKITLSPDEIAHAIEVGKNRNQENRKGKQKDGLVTSHQSSIGIDEQGSIAEYAFSKLTGIPWDGKLKSYSEWRTWRHEGHDVGMVEIKSTKLAYGNLLVRPHNADYAPYVCVLTHQEPEYIFAGWCWGYEAKQPKWWRGEIPKPAYIVKQDSLRGMSELLSMIPKLEHIVAEKELAGKE